MHQRDSDSQQTIQRNGKKKAVKGRHDIGKTNMIF